MATPKTISQRISLEGADAIKKLLTEIGQAGEKAFAQVQAATGPATKALEGFASATKVVDAEVRKFGSALSQVGTAGNNFGNALGGMATRVAGLVAVLTAAGAGIAAFGIRAIKTVDDLGESAAALGLNTQAYQGLQFAAAQAGVRQEQFATGMGRFAKQVTDAAAEQSKGLLAFAESSGKSLQQAGVFVVAAGRNFAEEFRVIGEAAARLQAELKARGIERPLFRIREELQKLANGGAEARKRFEELTGQSLPEINDGLKTLRLQAETGGNAIRRLGVATRDASGQIRPIEDVLGDVAEKFKALPEGAQRTALGLELFGRGAGPKLAAFLAQGRDGIKDTIKELERLGILLSKDEVDAADKAANALDLLGLSASNLRLKLGLVFADPIREGAGALTRLISENSASLQQFARDVSAKVVPVFKDLIRLISGKDAEIENKWIIEARDAVVSLGTAVQGAVVNIIVPAFRALMAILDTVAKGINAIFGTTLTGGQIGIAIVVAQLIGAFTVLAAGITLALTLLRAFVFTPFGAILTALALIILNWDTITKRLSSDWDATVTLWQDRYRRFLSQFSSDWDRTTALWKGWLAQLSSDWDKTVELWEKRYQRFIDFVKSLAPSLTQSPDRSGAGVPQGVPLVGGQTGLSPFDQLPQSPNIEDRRGEFTGQADQVKAEAQAFADAIFSIFREALEGVQKFNSDVFQSMATSYVTFSDLLRSSMENLLAVVVGTAKDIGEKVRDSVATVSDQINQSIREMLGTLVQAIAQIGSQVDQMIAQIIAALERAVAKAQELAAAAAAAAAAVASAGGGGGNAEGGGFARGGYTGHGGRFTPAGIVHRGEYVEPQHVVRRPGVLAFLEVLRRSGGDLNATISRFARGFEGGGLVAGLNRSLAVAALPSFAAGGLADGSLAALPHLGTVNLGLPGVGNVSVIVGSDAVSQLHRYALNESMTRIAKRPR